jgi:NADP-dependent 3-hydroxy acid dehydrogenase YdfG
LGDSWKKEKQKMGTSNITDKVLVITGASSGIGESAAKLLAQQGAKVVLGARRKDRIDAVVKEISAAGGKAIGFAVDVTNRAEVEGLVEGAVDSFGRVDVMVNDAGIMPCSGGPQQRRAGSVGRSTEFADTCGCA